MVAGARERAGVGGRVGARAVQLRAVEPIGAGGVGEVGGTAGTPGTDAGGVSECGGATPHGCYVPQPGNHPLCPPQTPEQSAFYPPADEWKGCNGIMPNAPFGGDPEASCSYEGPAGETATCLCDTGLHWLCAYPL